VLTRRSTLSRCDVSGKRVGRRGDTGQGCPPPACGGPAVRVRRVSSSARVATPPDGRTMIDQDYRARPPAAFRSPDARPAGCSLNSRLNADYYTAIVAAYVPRPNFPTRNPDMSRNKKGGALTRQMTVNVKCAAPRRDGWDTATDSLAGGTSRDRGQPGGAGVSASSTHSRVMKARNSIWTGTDRKHGPSSHGRTGS